MTSAYMTTGTDVQPSSSSQFLSLPQAAEFKTGASTRGSRSSIYAPVELMEHASISSRSMNRWNCCTCNRGSSSSEDDGAGKHGEESDVHCPSLSRSKARKPDARPELGYTGTGNGWWCWIVCAAAFFVQFVCQGIHLSLATLFVSSKLHARYNMTPMAQGRVYTTLILSLKRL